jgi:dihydroorotate dehydrogenase
VQVYTGLVYRGPGLVREINLALLAACQRQGAASVGGLAQPGTL